MSRRAIAAAGVLVTALACAAPASAAPTLSIGAKTIELSTRGASVTVSRHPFGLRFADGSGRTVLQEIAQPGSAPGLQVTLPGVAGAPPAVTTPGMFAPLAFTVGTQQLTAYSSGFWEGNLMGVATTGAQYWATDVLSAKAIARGVALVLSTSDPTGRQLQVSLTAGPGRIEVSVSPSPATGVATVGDSFASAGEEAFRGFGGRHNALNQHGNAFYSWTEEENVDAGPFQTGANAIPGGGGSNYLFPNGPTAAYYPQPFFISSRGYGFLLDQPDYAQFDLDSARPDAWQTDVGAGSLRYVVAPGPATTAIATLTALTGRQRIPPAWGLGPMLDRLVGSGGDTFFSLVEQDIADLARHRVPLRAYRVEGWDTISEDQDRRLFAQLHARHIHPLVYFRAYVGKHANTTHGGEMLDYAVQHGYVATNAAGAPYTFGDPEEGVGAVIDFTNPAARAWWAQRIDAALDLGADGFMQDFGEQVMPDMHFADGETGVSMHNRYPVLYHQATRQALDAYARRHPGRSFFFFTRSGYTGRPGTAAYENANFPGDETTDWTHSSGLASIIPDMLNRAIGGAYGYGTDIGGYTDITTPATTKELFLRWAEAAALTPVFRLHGSVQAGTHTPWSYDAQTLRTYIGLSRLHLAGAPLILKLWRQAVRTGIPPTRPLWLIYPNDAAAAAQDEEFLLGPDVLVAPVVTQGATTQRVYFPAGCWRTPARGRRYRGRGYRTVPAPLTRLPYFFRCGRRPFRPPRGV